MSLVCSCLIYALMTAHQKAGCESVGCPVPPLEETWAKVFACGRAHSREPRRSLLRPLHKHPLPVTHLPIWVFCWHSQRHAPEIQVRISGGRVWASGAKPHWCQIRHKRICFVYLLPWVYDPGKAIGHRAIPYPHSQLANGHVQDSQDEHKIPQNRILECVHDKRPGACMICPVAIMHSLARRLTARDEENPLKDCGVLSDWRFSGHRDNFFENEKRLFIFMTLTLH